MKRRTTYVVPAVLSMYLAVAGDVAAGELGHYQAGLLNTRDFAVPEPGFYTALYAFQYRTDTLKNRNGDEIGTLSLTGPLGGTTTFALEADVDVFAISPLLLWVSPWEILGARYAAAIAPSFADGSLNASLSVARSGRFFQGGFDRDLEADTGLGVGDLYVQPVTLGWTGKHYDVLAAYGFYAPVGEENIGLDFWTHQLQMAGTWYPFDNKGTAVTVASTYEIHHEIEDQDLTPGSRFTLNWGISQYLPLNSGQTWLGEIGATGYSQWQVEEDSGSDVPRILNTQLNAQDEIHAAGLQSGITFVPWKMALTVRYLWEFGAEARSKGSTWASRSRRDSKCLIIGYQAFLVGNRRARPHWIVLSLIRA